MVHVKILGAVRVVAVIPLVAQGNLDTADLANRPVNAVAAFPGGIVVDAQNKGVHSQIAQGQRSHGTIERQALGIASGKVAGRRPRVGNGLDVIPGGVGHCGLDHTDIHG